MEKTSKSGYIFIPPVIFASFLLAFYLTFNILPGPEFVFLCLFLYTSYTKSNNCFVRTFMPFIVSFLSYEALNRLISNVPRYIHVHEPIAADLWIFNAVPALVLQQSIRTPILDYIGAAFYSLHFVAPTIFAFILWKYQPEHYRKYVLAFMICTYSALTTFLIYPVAPPWYGVGATRILFQVDHNLGFPMYRAIYDYLGVNSFAAFPSLHSAIPWLIALSALKTWKKKALPILIFPVMVWFSAIYLGEHYVIDVIGGVVYATLAFIAAHNKDRIVKAKFSFDGNVADSILDGLEKVKLPIYRRSEQIYACMIKRTLW
ncbi:inositol phosphorylceramide synthase [Candidatus Bathyarchaeota archaeon]|nr:inositol phosphorylceramide synthase [Candidatus Bathyarchaeota archaeon]